MVIKKTVVGNIDHRRSIREMAGKLADLLRESPEYDKLVAARRQLDDMGEYSQMLFRLRQQQMAMQMISLLDGEDYEEESQELADSIAELLSEPAVNDYLFAEGRFFRLIADVEEIFTDKLNLLPESENEFSPRAGYDIRLN